MSLQYEGLVSDSRKMLEGDIDSVYAIEKLCHTHPWSKKQFLSSIRSHHHCLVVENNSVIIAYAIVSVVLREAELLNITVGSDVQGKGVGKAFLQALCTGFSSIADTFFLEVRESNTPAINLYQVLNFNEVGVRPNYYPAKNGREDAIIMAKILNSPFNNE